ncbi:TetR family transcriptional regulator [Rhizocola hellebori]|uniref:TetR family transcriptional regulator n=1 Tax=Rhizocola hellebori TaxID=1392758 RepID=A0A8J3QM68_9ACTN|nr:TetR/AcrR family transcriptional regulator C-terminal domain-containing protein [Rhizocola hellebori]GIH11586.1 TetR family transcriptional regulator [Rhizocola hellebori]
MARPPLSKERVLRAAVALADDIGIEALSMRKLAQELGVVPMALYKHVTNKDELLDGMVDVIMAQIDPPAVGTDWKSAVRQRILSARQALLRHRWASQVIESRAAPTPAVMDYLDSMIGLFRTGGLSVDLTHHVMHAMGSRILGFSQELFDDSGPANPEEQAAAMSAMAQRYPYITEMAIAASHTDESVVGSGCDDQFEFEFALDILLDGIARLHRAAMAG